MQTWPTSPSVFTIINYIITTKLLHNCCSVLNDAAKAAYPSKHRGTCRDCLDAVEVLIVVLVQSKHTKPAASTHRAAYLTPSAGRTAPLAPAVPDRLTNVSQGTPGAYSRLAWGTGPH
ncbi:hypothetical protein ABBQ32_000269 [Trebouxia sp. C0010 RCD-2024]